MIQPLHYLKNKALLIRNEQLEIRNSNNLEQLEKLSIKNNELEIRKEQLMQLQPIATLSAPMKPFIPVVSKVKEITDNKSIPLIDLESKPLAITSKPSMDFDLPPINIPEKTWKKYEVGINSSSLTFNMELTNNFENISSLQSERSYYIADATAYGFHFGYAPFENFYIRTGFRYADFFIDNSYISGIIYDSNNEYINDNGKVANDLLFNSSTNYNSIAQEITVEIPSGVTLETGDV